MLERDTAHESLLNDITDGCCREVCASGEDRAIICNSLTGLSISLTDKVFFCLNGPYN